MTDDYNQHFFQKVNLLRFLSIVGVLYIHAENWGQFGFLGGTSAYVVEKELIGSCEWAVPLFFFISAFLFFKNFTWDLLIPKWRRRVKTLLLPYLLWNAIYFILFAILPKLPFLSGVINSAPAPITVNEMFQSVFLHKYSGFLWFVKTLMLLTLCAPVFYVALSKRWISESILLFLFAMLFVKPFVFPAVTNLNWRFIFFYATGAYVSLRCPQVLLKRPPRNIRIALGVSIPLLIILNAFYDTELYSILMIVCLWYSIDMNAVAETKVFDVSFFIYALHILVFSIIKKIHYALLPHTEISMVISYLTVPVFALLVLIPLANLLRKHTPGVYKLLTGGR